MWQIFREEQIFPEESNAMAPADVVALSLLLDEWCRRRGINHFHPSAEDAARNLIAGLKAGATIDHLKQSLEPGVAV